MKSIPSGTALSWTELPRKYQVQNAQGNAPGNAGQVLNLLTGRVIGIDNLLTSLCFGLRTRRK
jgi:hypothetical protein